MDFDETLKIIRERQLEGNVELSYDKIYEEFQHVTDPVKITNLIKVLLKKFTENRDRDTFFQLNFPVIIFKLALLKYNEFSIFYHCSVLLNKVLSETPEKTNNLEEQIIRCLHKPEHNETLQFYVLIGNMCTSSTSAEAMLHSAIPALLIKFYHSKISSKSRNTQIFESLDYETLKNAEDSDNSDSDKSGATMASSLSLDEDIAYKRNDDNRPLSARSILSDFGNTLLDDEDEENAEEDELSDREDDFDNESIRYDGKEGEVEYSMSDSRRGEDFENDAAFSQSGGSMMNGDRELTKVDLQDTGAMQDIEAEGRPVSELENLPKKPVIQLSKSAFEYAKVISRETSCLNGMDRPNASIEFSTKAKFLAGEVENDSKAKKSIQMIPNETSDMLLINTNEFDYIRQKEVLAIAGPLCLPMRESEKPKFVPNLEVKLLKNMNQAMLEEDIMQNRQRVFQMDNETNGQRPGKTTFNPMNWGKKSDQLVDQTYIKELEFIDEQRKGSIVIEEIGTLLGEFMAMSEYPVITTLIKSDMIDELEEPILPNRADVYRERYFENRNAREVFDYGFNFTYFQKIMYIEDELAVRDIQRLGVIFVLHVLVRYSPQLTVQAIPSTHVFFTYDMLDMRAEKAGFLPASLLALHTLVTEITQARLTLELDEWENALNEMQTHVFSQFEYINALEEVETSKDDKHAYVQRTITLPSLVYLLERLEGTRRRLIPEMRLLATKLDDLVRLYRNLSAVEDMPHVIGVLVDRLESSEGSKVMRACAVELLLPSIMRLIELILTKKIKNRQFYVFISHKIIQLLAVLMKTNGRSRDLQEANIDQIFLKMLVFDASDIVPWLRRYGYLMLVTSRVEFELSGLFIDAQQCDQTFEQIRISFAEFCGNLARLVKNFYFERFNDAEDTKLVDCQNTFIPPEANLEEMGHEPNDDSEYDLDQYVHIHELPMHSVCECITDACLYKEKSSNFFVKQHNCIRNKEVYNGIRIDFSEYLFLIDYNSGVLTQYTMLSQAAIFKQEKDRLVYHNCLLAIRDLISVPNFVEVIRQYQINKHIIYHYTSFLRFYNLALAQMNDNFKVTAFELADAHLQVLIEFVNTGDVAIRQQFLIIKLIDFLTQQIMYESLSDSEKAMNRLEKTSLLPTYRANDSEETLSDLDFGLDEDQPVSKQEMLPPSVAGLQLHFEELEQQAKEAKDEQSSEEQNIDEFFDEPEETRDTPSLPINIFDEELASKAANAFALITERDTGDYDTSRRETPVTAPFELTLKMPNPASSLHRPRQESQDIDSDMDGWENTATRLNIDIGQDTESKEESPSDPPLNASNDFSDSDDIPLCEPIQKMNFGLELNLGGVEEKRADLKPNNDSSPQNQTEKVDLNLKMHLVLANESARKPTDVLDTGNENTKKRNLGEDTIPLVYQDDGIQLFGQRKKAEIEEDMEVPYNPIYYDDYLHFSIIKLILLLILNPKTGGLDANYVTEFPTNNGLMNIPVILHNHLNSKRNVKIVEMLINAQFNCNARRLLRLLCYSQFNPEYYDLKNYKLLAKGAYGEVYSGYVNVTQNEQYQKHSIPVAVKLQKLSSGLEDRCVLHDIFEEVTVLECVEEDGKFCELLDYGVAPEGYIIVMRRYYTSFKNLREKLFDNEELTLRYHNSARRMLYYGHEYSMMRYVRLFLLTYISFLKHLDIMHSKYKIIHFDLKCDNLFVDPASIKWLTQKSPPEDMQNFVRDILAKHIKAHNEDELPFEIALSDFGESHIFSSDEDENTLLSKGTEFNKSPEMLVATNEQFAKSFNRRRQKGAGIPSDIWSSACTLYEILTNDYLFYDNDWIRFFLRVTSINSGTEYAKDSQTFKDCSSFATLLRGVRLPPEKRAMLGNCVPLIDLLEFELVQDPAKRPSISMIIQLTEYVLDTYFPLEYHFESSKYEKGTKLDTFEEGLPFSPYAFQFSIDAAQELCMANPQEILAPKCSVIVKDENITGSRLSTVTLKYEQTKPADLLQNGEILIGSVHDAEDAKCMNITDVSTVIDCTLTSAKAESKITTISHVYRPDLRLFETYSGDKRLEHSLNFRELVIALEEVFDVVRCAIVKNSAVLLVDEGGNQFAACIAVACLMEFESLGLYAAVVYLTRIRPTVELTPQFLTFLSFLQAWHDNRTKIGLKMISMFAHLELNSRISMEEPEHYELASQRIAESNYRCVCGKVFFVQKMFADINYVLCNCVCSIRNKTTLKAGKPAACPSPSCRTLQNYYLSLYGFKMRKMLYAYGKDGDFISNWPRATIQAENAPEFKAAENQQIEFKTVDNMRSPLYRLGKKDGWSLFICKICGGPSHFIRVEAGEDQREICVVCNISNI